MRCLAIVAALLLLAAGCQAVAQPQSSEEASLEAQIASVRGGQSDRIHIETVPLGDDDLARLSELTALRELLVDEPRSLFSPAGLQRLKGLPNLTHLRIRGEIDDVALAELAELKSLKILNVPQGTFSDEPLASLRQLPQLEQLRFGSKRVTDTGVKTLADFPALLRLHLIDVPITDAGLRELMSIERLESLYIDGGEFSNAAVDELFRTRPTLHVHFNQQHHDRDPQKDE
jgi:hypothetical protein